jgi:transposase InsO family protein
LNGPPRGPALVSNEINDPQSLDKCVIARPGPDDSCEDLKCEEVYLWDYHNVEDVKHRIPYFLQEVYNQKRLHSALGYVTPEEFEQAELASVA